jgi:hypothetical protein
MKGNDNLFKQIDSVFEEADKIFKEVDDMVKHSFVARKIEAGPWKPWFAWHPVTIHGKRVWMEKVFRRCINTYVDYDNWKRYEYGTLFDVIKGDE